MQSDPLSRVLAVLQHELDRSRFPHKAPTVTPDAELVRDLRCCGVDFQCFAMAVDEEFGIEIPDRFVEEGSPDIWRTPADVARCVTELLSHYPAKETSACTA